MESMITKLKSLYKQYDKLEAAGEDVVADLRKEINNLELSYLKEEVLPQVASFIGSKIKELRCGIDCNFQTDGKSELKYSFCTSEVMLLVKDSLRFEQIAEAGDENKIEERNNDFVNETSPKYVANNIRIVDYSEKAIAVYGDSRAFVDQFKGIGGYFNAHLKEGPGWVFSKKRKEEVLSCLSDDSTLNQLSGRKSNNIENSNHQVRLIDDLDKSSSETDNVILPLSQEEWITKLSNMRGRNNNGYPSPHKPIFILTIIEGIKQGLVTTPIIYPMVRLSDMFKKIWNQYVPVDWPYTANYYQTFMHMSGEDFYTLEKAVGISDFDINQNWTKYTVNKYVRYGKLDKNLFYLFLNSDFTSKMRTSLLKMFTTGGLSNNKTNETSDYTSNDEVTILRKDLEIKKKFDLSNLGFKRFLLSIKNPNGDCYPIRKVDQYVASLESTYMFKLILKYQKKGGVYDIADLSILKNILNEVRKDNKSSSSNGVCLSAMELYVRFFNLVIAQRSLEEDTIKECRHGRKKNPVQLPCGAKVKWIRTKDFSISGARNSSNLLYDFIVAVGVEKVYEMKIPFLKGYLVDKSRNLKYLTHCKYLNGGYWLNAAGSLAKKIEQIQLIASNLNIEIEIEISR